MKTIQETLAALDLWQYSEVPWLDKELHWLMGNSKSAKDRPSEDGICEASRQFHQNWTGYRV